MNILAFKKPVKKQISWRFFGLNPCRDKSLDCILDGYCPDCNGISFVIEIKRGITHAECDSCRNKFLVSPVSIERIAD
jgi:hypothetical protein